MTKQLRSAQIRETEPPDVPSYGFGALQFMKELNQIRDRVLATDAQGKFLSLESAFTEAMEQMVFCCRKGNKLIFIGNGGSAAISSHQAVDYWKNGGLEAIAFNDSSLLTCISNDYGYERVFAEPIRRFAKTGDCVLAISSSGKSPNILQAVEAAQKSGCDVITFSGFNPLNPLRSLGGMNFFVPSYSYGIVEITHLTVIHALLESYISSKTPPAKNGKSG